MFPVELLKRQDVIGGHAARELFAGREGNVSKVRQRGRRVAEVLQMLLLLLGARQAAGHRRRARLTAVAGHESTLIPVRFEPESPITAAAVVPKPAVSCGLIG